MHGLEVDLDRPFDLALVLEPLGLELELLDVQGSPRLGNREMAKT
jgi:hypothetical protein